MSELKPCPFCGEPADDRYNRLAKCSNKSCLMNHWIDDEDFFIDDDWNTRPIEDALRARIAELEAERRWKDSNVELPKDDTDGNALIVIHRYSGEWARAPFGIEFSDEFVRHYSHWMIAPQLPEVQE